MRTCGLNPTSRLLKQCSRHRKKPSRQLPDKPRFPRKSRANPNHRLLCQDLCVRIRTKRRRTNNDAKHAGQYEGGFGLAHAPDDQESESNRAGEEQPAGVGAPPAGAAGSSLVGVRAADSRRDGGGPARSKQDRNGRQRRRQQTFSHIGKERRPEDGRGSRVRVDEEGNRYVERERRNLERSQKKTTAVRIIISDFGFGSRSKESKSPVSASAPGSRSRPRFSSIPREVRTPLPTSCPLAPSTATLRSSGALIPLRTFTNGMWKASTECATREKTCRS